MKSGGKGLLIMAAILLGTGVVATTAGLMMGARFGDTEFGFMDIGPHGFVIAGDGWDDGWSDDSLPAPEAPEAPKAPEAPEAPKAPEAPEAPAKPGVASVGSSDWRGTINESYDTTINKVSISVGPADAKIVEGDGFSVRADGDDIVRFRSYVDNDELKIVSDTRRNADLANHDVTITITVPKDWVAEEWDVDIGMGSLNADVIRGKKVDLVTGMGEMNVDTLESAETDLQCDMGQLTVDRATITGKTKLECGMGQITMTVVGSEDDFGGKLDVGMGNIQVGNRSVGGMGGSLEYNVGSANIFEGDCGMGQIDIGFTS